MQDMFAGILTNYNRLGIRGVAFVFANVLQDSSLRLRGQRAPRRGGGREEGGGGEARRRARGREVRH